MEFKRRLKQLILIKATEEEKWVNEIKKEMQLLCRSYRNEDLNKRNYVSRQTINSWLSGLTTPTKENYKKLCDYFRVKKI